MSVQWLVLGGLETPMDAMRGGTGTSTGPFLET